MSVWKVRRATSYLLWPSASSPRSKSTLSGCCEFRLASGLLFFFLWCSGQIQALAAIEVSSASTTTVRDLRNITTSGDFIKGCRAQSARVCAMPHPELRITLSILDLLQRGFTCQFEQFLSAATSVIVAEDGAAGHQNFRARAHYFGDGIRSNAAIHLNAEVQPPRFAHLGQLADFVYGVRIELLPAKAWIHGHHQHKIHNREHFA